MYPVSLVSLREVHSEKKVGVGDHSGWRLASGLGFQRTQSYAAAMSKPHKTQQPWESFFKQGSGVSEDFQRGEQDPLTANDSVDANLKRMQNPLFKRLARTFEQSVPENVGFGRFRDGK